MKQSGKTILLTMLIFGAVILLWRQFERVPIVQHDSPTNQPQAAAMQLLHSWHKESRRIISSAELFPLPDSSVLLIIERHQSRLPQWQQQALIDWVESGGSLVINALPIDESKDQSTEDIINHDPLLYHFGVTSWHYPDVDGRPALPLPVANGVAVLDYGFRRHCLDSSDDMDECTAFLCGEERAHLQYAWLNDSDGALQLDLEPSIDLLHRDLFEEVDNSDPSIPASNTSVLARANNETHDLALQLAAGAGEIWLFTSLDIFSNDRLHHLDHAALLQQISADKPQIWWVQSINVPPLSQWLWQRGWPLISALALLLLIFLWHKIPRRGVILQASSLQHQDFTDHLRASSALLWRIGQRSELLQPLRQQVERALLRHPGGADPERRTALAMALSGLSEEQVKRAFDELPENETKMVELVTLLQHLRASV
ncbi:DUF4350 domain-containing protein [Alcanivorax sp. 1008]|uniref:DUF4350 domain-containing protein n=1 Tax=Alcanivorax sp. 1008 TaxID=2816853 RepID=UPI001DBAF4E2|nr:DUF4350 domain-containing protein [Alcanivorax sp. 1008]MCC1497667.1 hypothetical protein [Alcanivorax sp. 1008]